MNLSQALKKAPKPGTDAMVHLKKLGEYVEREAKRLNVPTIFATGGQRVSLAAPQRAMPVEEMDWQLAYFWAGGPHPNATREILKQMLANVPEFREQVRDLIAEIDALRL